ncbi:hypothetical protein HY29_02350 [Hyphomonas beringensis]|uniref:Glycerophosphoryl diester phosphodiesterase membrane domain-containing protein n=1 Tax=Hyphomonas beringensis TaxID=1280946 RepID=A0A062U424_9PROT|nr:hypothetical protein [Hyphomonas beringensis]KCZ55071.1 hypothetical protein HY29_02350 [Hyphomonas beringensis]
MTQLQFSFGNALNHFSRTGGPKGFLWKFALAYGVCSLLVQAASAFFMGSYYAAMFNPAMMGNPDALNDAMLQNFGRIMIGYAISLVGGIALWTVFEAASQRRYMRGEGFSLRFGADEGRILLIGLIWIGIFLALYIGLFIVMLVPMGVLAFTASSGSDGGTAFAVLLMLVFILAYMVFALWFCARFSPAAAMTIRDKTIQFGEAWRVSKGKAWTIVGSWIVLMLISTVVLVVLYIAFGAFALVSLLPALQGNGDPEAVLSGMMSPQFILPLIIFGALYMFITAALMHIFGGPAALAARADPNWVNNPEMDKTFS